MPWRILIAGVGLLTVALGCGDTRRSSRETPTEISAIYATVLESCCATVRDTLYVVDSSATFHGPSDSSSASWAAEWSDIPDELTARIGPAVLPSRSSLALGLPRALVIVTPILRDSIFGRGRGGWDEWRRRFPGAQALHQFSPVVLSADGHQALVYHESSNADLAGSGYAYWLARDANGRWRERKRIMFWIS